MLVMYIWISRHSISFVVLSVLMKWLFKRCLFRGVNVGIFHLPFVCVCWRGGGGEGLVREKNCTQTYLL